MSGIYRNKKMDKELYAGLWQAVSMPIIKHDVESQQPFSHLLQKCFLFCIIGISNRVAILQLGQS